VKLQGWRLRAQFYLSIALLGLLPTEITDSYSYCSGISAIDLPEPIIHEMAGLITSFS
jgi:hypothetical protein